jgi:hypothetical protein
MLPANGILAGAWKETAIRWNAYICLRKPTFGEIFRADSWENGFISDGWPMFGMV